MIKHFEVNNANIQGESKALSVSGHLALFRNLAVPHATVIAWAAFQGLVSRF